MCDFGSIASIAKEALPVVAQVGSAYLQQKGAKEQADEQRRALQERQAIQEQALGQQRRIMFDALPSIAPTASFSAGGSYDQAAETQHNGMTADLAKIQNTAAGEGATGKVSDAYTQARADASARMLERAIKDAQLTARANAGGNVMRQNQSTLGTMSTDMNGVMSDARLKASKVQADPSAGGKNALAATFLGLVK